MQGVTCHSFKQTQCAFLTLRYESVSIRGMFRVAIDFNCIPVYTYPYTVGLYAFNEIHRKSNISPRCVWENRPGILKAALRLDVHF